MAQLPPPVHGAALRNQSLLDSELINSHFQLLPLPLKYIDDITQIHKFSLSKIYRMIADAFAMIRIFFTRPIDLVYFTMSPSGGAFYRDILFMTIIKVFRKKRLLHFRVKGIRKTGRTIFGRRLIRYALKNSDIVCLSKHHLKDFEGFNDRTPFIVPNGIKVEKNNGGSADKQTNPVTRILFLSNFSKKKGLPELIKALAILRKREYHFTASLVGSEWDMSFADVRNELNHAGLKELVTIEGPRYGEEKNKQLARADLFVFPTYFELFPGVILEAMQFGKAIVSTFEGSIPEMIDHQVNGILVENRNVEELANAIAFLIDHPETRRKMGQLAQEKFFREYTLEIFEEKMYEVYDQVINSR